MSQRLFAFRYGWSSQQLKRIEAGTVAPRFGPLWELCFMAQINPLWLAFGEPRARYGCKAVDVLGKHPELTPEMPFIEVMRVVADEYEKEAGEVPWGVRWTGAKRPGVFDLRATLAELTARFAERIPRNEQQAFMAYLAACADRFIAKKAISTKTVDTALNIQNNWILTVSSRKSHWQQLRRRVVHATTRRGARRALAKLLRVTPQALNEWLHDRSAPPAEQTLRLWWWLEAEAREKNRDGRAKTRPPHKPKKGKSVKNEKPNSGWKKN
jgi:transcriptional regulator with XRE-family HTH domain